MLRYGAGYALINDGVDVRLLQEFLGHASITSTAIYTAISPKRPPRALPGCDDSLPYGLSSRPDIR
jgi:site-specific recombinase XerD